MRVVLGRPDFGDLLDGGIAQPRSFAGTNPTVLDRIAQLLREVGWSAPGTAEKQAVRDQVLRLEETIAEADLGSAENVSLAGRILLIHRAPGGHW